jgi:hypothetical protein
MITKFKIYEKKHEDLDPYDEEIWEEYNMENLLDEHLVNFEVSLNWGYDCYDKEIIEKVIKDYEKIDKREKELPDDFYEKWKEFFIYKIPENYKDYFTKEIWYPQKSDWIHLKINFKFDDDSDIFMSFDPISLKHVGGRAMSLLFNRYNCAVAMHELMEPRSYNPFIRDHKYNFDYFQEKLGIDLDV